MTHEWRREIASDVFDAPGGPHSSVTRPQARPPRRHVSMGGKRKGMRRDFGGVFEAP